MADQWATVADAARDTRVRQGTIRVWIHRGIVERRTIGGRTHVHLADVRRAERTMRMSGGRPWSRTARSA
ncbi:MAG: hypothetical protein FWH11_01335 [Micrococcales bacterium]|nr:hypothetical protein [Micrococcales bacterium]